MNIFAAIIETWCDWRREVGYNWTAGYLLSGCPWHIVRDAAEQTWAGKCWRDGSRQALKDWQNEHA